LSTQFLQIFFFSNHLKTILQRAIIEKAETGKQGILRPITHLSFFK
jgi:hypothetical protein